MPPLKVEVQTPLYSHKVPGWFSLQETTGGFILCVDWGPFSRATHMPMRYTSTVELVDIERLTTRNGFSDLYHKVTFELISDGIPASQLVVWVHPAYPEEDLVRVARTFAYSRLNDLSEAAREGAFSEDEIQVLWESIKPDNFVAK